MLILGKTRPYGGREPVGPYGCASHGGQDWSPEEDIDYKKIIDYRKIIDNRKSALIHPAHTRGRGRVCITRACPDGAAFGAPNFGGFRYTMSCTLQDILLYYYIYIYIYIYIILCPAENTVF